MAPCVGPSIRFAKLASRRCRLLSRGVVAIGSIAAGQVSGITSRLAVTPGPLRGVSDEQVRAAGAGGIRAKGRHMRKGLLGDARTAQFLATIVAKTCQRSEPPASTPGRARGSLTTLDQSKKKLDGNREICSKLPFHHSTE
jgi:hypothetical protein